ncbi:MAG: Uma2 family endonuclease [Intrasporangium sp.]|uniref:Uma2 family endonuclease n=1 Tax=Intrasporangium sp. TaxID=1925024 RepID=UPI002646FE3A|nr:Uma2 family endonuclease [Intrasporangium sp.]MDN5798338.1 Uma2 family endonuclease [Intrasporangium sp.]
MMTMTALPRSRPLVRADLEAMPDDGHRYELIDGVLIVTPAPALEHQRVVGRLHLLLSAATAPGIEVILAPFAVALADDTELQPDLIVARTADFTPRELPGPPLLAIEVLSPSTRRIDLTLKRDRLEAAGCPAYWCVDPVAMALTAWELEDERYVQVAHVAGTEVFEATRPFPVTVRPADLKR